MLGIGRGGHMPASDARAGPLRHLDPGFSVVVALRLTSASVLAGPAVVFAGLDNAGALFRIAGSGKAGLTDSRYAKRNEAGESASSDAIYRVHVQFLLVN
jgi:hypothetical protein